MQFLEWKLCFDFKSRKFVSNIIGSDNGLVPNRWQGVILTDDDQVYWYTPSGHFYKSLIVIVKQHSSYIHHCLYKYKKLH